MPVPFQIGDRVRFDALMHRSYGDESENSHIATWKKYPIPEPREGVIMGYRTAVDGFMDEDIECGEYGMILSRSKVFSVIPGTAQRYWLVVFDPRCNPEKVPEDAITLITDDEPNDDTPRTARDAWKRYKYLMCDHPRRQLRKREFIAGWEMRDGLEEETGRSS